MSLPPPDSQPTVLTSSRTALIVLMCAIAALACIMPAQNDTWWQLRAGEDIWRTGHPVLHDSYTHTVAGQYWPNHEWLSQAIFFAANSLGGLPLLTALCAGAVVAAWAIVWSITPAETVDRVLLVGVAAALSTAGWSLRPQVFTLALFALTLRMILRRHRPFLLPLVFLVWANLHGGVAAGGVLVASAILASLVVERRIDPRFLGMAVLCLAATALTPLGTSLWTEVPASLQRLKAYDVIEWRAPSLTNAGDQPFFLALATIVVLTVVRRHALRRWDTLFLAIASLGTALLALRSSRNATLFFVCAIPLAARLSNAARVDDRHEGTKKRSSGSRYAVAVGAAVTATLTFVTYAWSRPLDRLQWHPVSAQMYEALQACRGPLYNRYDEGGYLIWFVRNRPVFIDSRQDPFPEALVREQLDVERTGNYQDTFQRHGIACALTPSQSLLSGSLERDGWSVHDAGSGWRVYTRPVS